jgi:DNA mismatch repair protein MutS2
MMTTNLLPPTSSTPFGVDCLPTPLQADAIATLHLLEWHELHQLWHKHALTPEGQTSVEATPFLTTKSAMQTAQFEAEVFKSLVQRFGTVICSTLHKQSILPILQRLAKGGHLSLLDAALLLTGLQAFRHIHQHALKYLKHTLEDVQFTLRPQPFGASPAFEWLTETEDCILPLQTLLNVVTSEGIIREQASPTLAELTKKLKNQEVTLQTTLQRLLKTPTVLKALQEPTFTQRNGRYVLPVNVFYKTSVPGIVQDVSSSGGTLFIEPKPIVELSNRIQSTQYEIEAEIAQILRTLSIALEPEAPMLITFVEVGAWCDRTFATALLSKQLEGNPVHVLMDEPTATSRPKTIDFKTCKHPLLVQQLGNKTVIGNPLQLEKGSTQTLIITGPNTGGKTVLLKALGLSILMVQAGLHPCVAEQSQCHVIAPVLADIGDGQSLSQNLSTFSGQMKRLARFVDAGSDILQNSLLLIDEITAGTDPLEGAALARAILRTLHEQGAFTVVTTHLGVLKNEAHAQAGYVNASVAFDLDNLQPTYRLMMGVPGASNALNIAERLGLKSSIVDEARGLLESVARDSSSLLTELETRTVQATEAHEAVKTIQQELEKRLIETKQEQQAFRERKKQLVENYHLQFKARIRGLEDQAKRLKKQLQKAEQQPEQARYLPTQLKHLASQAAETIGEILAPLTDEIEVAAEALHQEAKPVFEVGMLVKCTKIEGKATIEAISADGKKFSLKVGHLKLTAKPSECTPEASLSQNAVLALKKAEHKTIIKRIAETAMHNKASAHLLPSGRYQTDCDVRGMRVEEAKEAIEAFLDNAHRMGFDTVGVIHGQGTGVLKKVVREYLKESPFVRTAYPEQAHLGGDGKTIVELKG